VIVGKNNSIVETSIEYDGCPLNTVCMMNVSISSYMTQPILVLYEIDNFYQNHRRYLSSQSLVQLSGEEITDSVANNECSPIVYNKDLKINYSWAGVKLNPESIASPCGLMARSFFTGFLL